MPQPARSAAVPAKPQRAPREVVVLAFDGVEALDVAAPASAFSKAALHVPGAYRVRVASPLGGAVATSAGFALADTLALQALAGPIDTVVVAGGEEAALRRAIFDDGVGRWLAATAPHTRRVASVCTGAFVLAAAGLLDQRDATTHANACDLLAHWSPGTRVQRDRVYVRDGAVWTSAGVTTGLDLALALIEDDLGRPAAMQVARDLAVYVLRPGGAPQRSPALEAQAEASARLRELMAWIPAHLTADLSVQALAQRVHMSPRNFARAFAAQAHCTPARFVAQLRAEHAAALLHQTGWPRDKVARRSGFGSVDAMARALRALPRPGAAPTQTLPLPSHGTHHDLPQPALRHVAQHPGTDPQQR